MSTHRIFADPQLSANATPLLQEGLSPHEIIVPQNRPASVLAKTDLAFLGWVLTEARQSSSSHGSLHKRV